MIMKKKQIALHALTAVATVGAIALLYRSLSQYSRDDIIQSLQALPWSNLGMACVFCAGSYLTLGLFDALAVRYAGKPLAFRRTTLASFCGLSIGHTIGLAALSSGAVRYRFYSRWGLSTEDIAKVIGFCGVTVGLGLAALAGIALTLRPQATAPLGIGEGAAVALGVACLACSAAYLVACAFLRGSVKLWRWHVEMPEFRLALGQLLVGTVNFVFVAACLHQLMRAYGPIGFLDVATAYVSGNVATLITHVPGGIGVLEATVMHLTSEQKAIGALIAFRVLYFLVPLFIGLPMFLASEVYFRGREPKESDKAPNRREATMPS